MVTQNHTPRRDPLRRFTPTPLAADLPVMGRVLRLATNSPTVLRQTRHAFEGYAASCSGRAEFVWRIVTEAGSELKPLWRDVTAFSDSSVRFVHFGPRSFVAVDLEAREAVGFLPEDLARDDIAFSRVFLGDLFYLTAGALRLTAIAAACVALGDKGLLLFGPPKSGKTTAGYLAGRRGMQFHADQATFVEIEGGGLRAWGEFWPAAFRVDATRFLPELVALTRPFEHHDFSFLCLARSPACSAGARSVVPASCIFLERGAAEVPRLIPLSSREFAERLRQSVPFKDDNQFEPDRHAIFRPVGELPAYRLLYGDDPAVTTPFLRSIFRADNLVEVQG
jgi:hypothetical protein